ncbi:MAG: UDP-2,3-diacylglucosamine diphosphatase [Burkholderiales bacterium]
MPHTLFVSDLHLAADRPLISEQFFAFVRDTARAAEALYILGDLFEYWIGDDDREEALNDAVASSLAALSARETRLYIMHGNRDLLIGADFAARCGATLISDPAIVALYGTRTLLMHGDTLCSDDLEYQAFRRYAHDTENQRKFLAQPLSARRDQMLAMRAKSEQVKKAKTDEIMDVTPATVDAALRAHGYPRLIHGHTHRPARHVHHVDGRECERWVLADWYQRGSYLRCDASGCTAVQLPG